MAHFLPLKKAAFYHISHPARISCYTTLLKIIHEILMVDVTIG